MEVGGAKNISFFIHRIKESFSVLETEDDIVGRGGARGKEIMRLIKNRECRPPSFDVSPKIRRKKWAE